MKSKLGWREMPRGASIVTPGSSLMNKTGTWRTFRPVIDEGRCNKCGLCWLFCPEAAIELPDYSINYDYCKGCGICAHECPLKAIIMVKEEV